MRVTILGGAFYWSIPRHSVNMRWLLFPTVGGMREYRTIAAATLYALSIIARYMPSAPRRIEGGDEDQYLLLSGRHWQFRSGFFPNISLQASQVRPFTRHNPEVGWRDSA